MKTVAFKEEAKRLNVPIDSITRAYRKMLNQGKIHGFVDSINQEFVCYQSRELTDLIERLGAERVSLPELAENLNLKVNQTRSLIEKLLREKKINGFVNNEDDTFISEDIMKKQLYGMIESTRTIDIPELSLGLNIPKEKIRNIINKMSGEVIKKIKPYEQISFTELSIDTNLPEHVAVAILKKNISENRIKGSLDMTNNILILKQSPKKLNKYETRDKFERRIQPEALQSQPSSAWYLVPLFIGIIGGVIGYIAVKDDDKNMANNLLILGIVSSFISSIIIWGVYGWYISRLLRWY